MALPYIDKHYDQPDVREAVDRLVADELRTMGPRPKKDPSESPVSLFESNASLAALLAQAARGENTNAIDASRFRLDAPPNTAATPENELRWAAAVKNAHAQLEHQHSRLANLELISAFGANAWKIANFQLEDTIKRLRAQLEDQKADILEVNKERKIDQRKAGVELEALEQRWNHLVDACLRVDIANQVLEAEIESTTSPS
ncbi:Pre-mRNA-splicing factor SPF27 [Chytriomyces sp. MP71]|nr:Pre-mRNA-splicing factor SPF27 [Chytriomyces sp. MP71]